MRAQREMNRTRASGLSSHQGKPLISAAYNTADSARAARRYLSAAHRLCKQYCIHRKLYCVDARMQLIWRLPALRARRNQTAFAADAVQSVRRSEANAVDLAPARAAAAPPAHVRAAPSSTVAAPAPATIP
eukprot:3941127-Rhodomonas_salina.1